MNANIYEALTLHCIQLLALLLLIILALELLVKHLRSLLDTIRLLYHDIKSWNAHKPKT